MNFSDYLKNENKTTKTSEDDLKKAYDDLKDKSPEELNKRLFDEVKKQKSEGTFNFDALSQSVESIKGYMSEETYKNIKSILETLK